MAYALPVVIRIPVQVSQYKEPGSIVIRAEVRVPDNVWKKPGWPTDEQIEAALAVAFSKLEMENLNG